MIPVQDMYFRVQVDRCLPCPILTRNHNGRHHLLEKDVNLENTDMNLSHYLFSLKQFVILWLSFQLMHLFARFSVYFLDADPLVRTLLTSEYELSMRVRLSLREGVEYMELY